MAAHPNEQIIRDIYTAFSSGDLPTLVRLLDENVSFQAAGTSWLAGGYHGRDAVLAFLGTIPQFSQGTYQLTIVDVMANDTHATGLHHVTAQRADGTQVSMDNMLLFRTADGRVTNIWATPWDQYEEDRFYGAAAPAGFSLPPRSQVHATSWSAAAEQAHG